MRRALLLLVLATACGKEDGAPVSPPAPATQGAGEETRAPLPSVDEARALIAGSSDFSEYEFTNASYSLPMQRSLMNEPARTAAADLRRAGWIGLDGAGNVTLTTRAKSDKRWLVRQNGFVDIVPLAKKELNEVTEVRADPEGAAVDFNWKWIPNEIGLAFRSGALKERYETPQQATATLIHDGTAWTILRIRPVIPSVSRNQNGLSP